MDSRLNQTWWVLRIGLGVVPILGGLDKFFNLLTNWEMYLHPAVPRLLHMQPATFMHVAGVIEIVAGVLILTRFTRFAAYLVMVWLWGISLNLILQLQFLDIAVRDVLISLGAFALGRLSEVRETENANEAVQHGSGSSDAVHSA